MNKIDAEKLAAAMGLPGTPKIKFGKGSTTNRKEEKREKAKIHIVDRDTAAAVVDLDSSH